MVHQGNHRQCNEEKTYKKLDFFMYTRKDKLAQASRIFGCTRPDSSCWRNCNGYGTIYAISSDFGDHMTTQSMRPMVLLSEHF